MEPSGSAPAPPAAAVLGLSGGRRRLADLSFRAAAVAGGLSVLAILGLIALSTSQEAWPAFRQEGPSFVTSARWVPNENVFGALAFIAGTLTASALAVAIAVPISVGIALFLSELAPRRLRKPVTYLIDLLAAVPSVVFGLWGVLVLAPAIVGVYDAISGWVEPVPILNTLFGGPATGRSIFTAALILALMITPIITSITREVFDTVPAGLKEAAYALSATRWEMIRGAIFPHSRSGMVGAVLLGLGRAMGETIAVALVIGSSPQLTARLFGSGDAMAAVIANEFGEAFGVWRSALIGLGVVLLAMTVAVNVFARAVAGPAPTAGARR